LRPPRPLGGALIAEELRQVLGLPLAENPAAGADNCLFSGPRNAVLLLWTTRAPEPDPLCSVRSGTALLFVTIDGGPFAGTNRAIVNVGR
jgi:hypothetical protein